MATKMNDARTLDGNPEVQTEAFPASRSDNYYPQSEREQSGGLSDDPTESGLPVKNRRPFRNLKGDSR